LVRPQQRVCAGFAAGNRIGSRPYGGGIFPIPAQVAPLAGYPVGVGFLFA
jgi:hypothetical protein